MNSIKIIEAKKRKIFKDTYIIVFVLIIVIIGFMLYMNKFKQLNKDRNLINQLTNLCQSYNFTPTFNNLKGFTFFTHRDIKGVYLYNYSNSTYTCLERDTFCIEGIYLCFDGELHSEILNYTTIK